MLFLILIFTFIFTASLINAKEAAVCKRVQQRGFFSMPSKDIPSNALVKFSFDMSVSFNPTDSSFPNILIISNFSFSNMKKADENNNFTFNNLSFTFFGNPHKIIDCFLIKSIENCTFKFGNGEIIYFLKYKYFKSQKIAIGPNLYVNDGIFFDGKTAELWNPITNLSCINYDSTNENMHFLQTCCCTSFENIQIPNSNNEKCQTFETFSTISDPSTIKSVTIKAHYSVSSNNSLVINVSLLKSPDPAYIYYVYVGYPFVSYINGSSITQNTSFSLNLENEKQYEILFDYNPSASDSGDGIFKYGGVNLGEIIIRNGMFLKNINQPYSSVNPCWTKFAKVPFTNAIYNSSFCCTNFFPQTSTKSSSSLPSTTSSNKTNNVEINLFLLLITFFCGKSFNFEKLFT